MDYADPYHKRVELEANSFGTISDEGSVGLEFGCPDGIVTLRRRGRALAVSISSDYADVAVWKIQLLDKLAWFIVDARDTRLTRIVLHIGGLDREVLWKAVLAVVDGAEVLSYRH
jgi:hypothetical protein